MASTSSRSESARRARPDWSRYLDDFHDDRPGITEQVLAAATSGGGDTPYQWLAGPLTGSEGPVLDLACGSAPTQPLLAASRWLGVDASAGELVLAQTTGRGPLVRARAGRLPLADGSVADVCAAMSLQVLTPLDDVLREVVRVLRPGGRIVALVPASLGGPRRGAFMWWRLMRALGVLTQPWPNPHALDGLADVLREHALVVDADERRVFRREISDPAEASVLIDSLYLPDVEPEHVSDAERTLAAWARPGRSLPLPLRRVIAHLPQLGPRE
ncbi:class I SAM-dependent methyltransferase [Haloechinothrix salitolerans]|uniref:Class I SAM-dependent methyltransferase n=1 Tax=Haloechinothrix salitolerans TaxID=926830 RepID=A0ABW2C4H8_9PSEU